MQFKGHKVWVAVDNSGSIRIDNDKALIKYQLDQDYEYRVHSSALYSLDDQSPPASPTTARKISVTSPDDLIVRQPDENCIHIYTDGASSGNPGPSGIGVFMRYRDHEKEISRYIGTKTNNIAELEAIRSGLLAVRQRNIPVRIYTDSSYAFGLLSLGWKARKHREFVGEIQKLTRQFSDLKFIKIKGHCGVEGNERADRLATSAIKMSTSGTSH